jgi:hypothetical protein
MTTKIAVHYDGFGGLSMATADDALSPELGTGPVILQFLGRSGQQISASRP